MDPNLPPVRHSSTAPPVSGAAERRAGTVAAAIGAGVLLVVVSFTVAYVLMSGVNRSGERTTDLSAHPAPTTTAPGAAVPFATTAPTVTPQYTTTAPEPTATRLLTSDGTPAAPRAVAPAAGLPSRAFALKNAVTGKCVRLIKDALSQRTCKKGEKAWKLQRTRTVDGVALYRIRKADGGAVCLDVPMFDVQPEGTVLGTFNCVSPATKDNQEFQIEAKKSGYLLKNWKNQLCVDVSGTAKDRTDRKIGATLTLYRCQDKVFGYDDHLWRFS